MFRLALRAVKYWASQRGISSNVMGYLGGVNLAIMVAKICQLYPRAGERWAKALLAGVLYWCHWYLQQQYAGYAPAAPVRVLPFRAL